MSASSSRRDSLSDAAASLLLPGLGQYLQGRHAAALYFVAEAIALLVALVLIPHYRTGILVGLSLLTLWSALDAARTTAGIRAPAA